MLYTTVGLIKFLSHFSYSGIIIYFSSIGYFIPIPDEGILVVFGYLSGIGKFNFWLVFISIIFGVSICNNIFYWLSFKESHHLAKLKKKINEKVWLKYEKLMERNIGKTMLLLKLFLGFRFLGSIIAGSLKIKWRRFFLYDILISLGYTSIFMYAGYFFRYRLAHIISFIEQFRSFLMSVVAITIISILVVIILKKK